MGLSREQERAAWYLAGIMDGEGCAGHKITIATTDGSINARIDEALVLLDIPFTIHYRRFDDHRRDLTVFQISSRDGMERFDKLVPFFCEDKRQRLRDRIAMPRCDKRTPERIDQARHCIASGLSYRATCKEVGISPTTFKRWRREGVL